MKKILASYLTSLALIGSMSFSTPLAQVNATIPTRHEIEVGVEEVCTDHTCEFFTNLENGVKVNQQIEVVDNITGQPTCVGADRVYEDKLVFTITKAEGSITFETPVDKGSRYTKDPNVHTIKWSGLEEDIIPDKDNIPLTTIDFSQDTTKPENLANFNGRASHFKRSTTKGKLKPGESFSLNVPEIMVNSGRYNSIILGSPENFMVDGEKVDDIDDYIEWEDKDTDEGDDDTSDITDTDGSQGARPLSNDPAFTRGVKGKIKENAPIDTTLTFDVQFVANVRLVSSIGDTTTLVTYNSEIEPEPGPDLDPDLMAEGAFTIPVEFKISDEEDGKGDIIDPDDDIDVIFTVSPEYKKLTKKGETYKVETTLELAEGVDAEAKESFEAMKKDGNFKVLFASRDLGVATVDENGTVTAVDNGSTEIIAYVEGYEDELIGISKVDVEIPEESSSDYPKTGDNFTAVSVAILTLGLAAFILAFVPKKQKI